MLRGEQKPLHCTDDVVVEPGREIGALDCNGVDTLDNRPKETGEGGMVMGGATAESGAVDKDERGFGTEDALDDDDR